MNTKSGYCELKGPNGLIPCKFSTNTFLLFCQQQGIALHQLDKKLESGDPLMMRDMTYCAMVTAARIVGKEPPLPTPEAIGEVLFDSTDAIELVSEAMLSARVFGKSLNDSPATKKKKSRSPGTTS